MCQLLISCATKETVNYPFGSLKFCKNSFNKFANKKAFEKDSVNFSILINPKDADKFPKSVETFECPYVPSCTMFLLPPCNYAGAISTALKSTATQSGNFDGVFWTEATYSIIYGEQVGWYSN